MRRTIYYLFGFLLIIIISTACGNGRNEVSDEKHLSYITSQEDGSIILDLENAYLLQDSLRPDMNTAEWFFKIKKKGRYELWLSSYTRDTMNLRYDGPVYINFRDKKIKAESIIGNEIVLDTPNIGNMYYRADSKLGSVYVEQAGEYNIQISGSQVRPCEISSLSNSSRHTELRSLILKPMTE
jgi:hypothetical protein